MLEKAHPLSDIEGHSVHLGLEVRVDAPTTAGIASAVIADEIGDDALDGGTELEILLALVGLGIGTCFCEC